MGEAVKLAGKAKGLVKAKALGDNAVAPVLPVTCGLLGGGPGFATTCGASCRFITSLACAEICEAAPVSNVAPPIAKGIPPGLALPAFHEGLHPVGFAPAVGRGMAPPEEVGAGPPPLALVSDPTFDCLGDTARWIHGPAGFDELHRLCVNPGDFVEFLVYDHGGLSSATSIVRLTRRWPGNATGWFAEVLFVCCSDPLFGHLLADLLPTHRNWSATHLFKRLIFVLHMGDLAETRCGSQ